MQVTKVYRGPGGKLGDNYWRRDAFNLAGGVDFSFASTTHDYEIAAETDNYARHIVDLALQTWKAHPAFSATVVAFSMGLSLSYLCEVFFRLSDTFASSLLVQVAPSPF